MILRIAKTPPSPLLSQTNTPTLALSSPMVWAPRLCISQPPITILQHPDLKTLDHQTPQILRQPQSNSILLRMLIICTPFNHTNTHSNYYIKFQPESLGKLGLLCMELTEIFKTETMLLSMASSLTLCDIPQYFVDTTLQHSKIPIVGK